MSLEIWLAFVVACAILLVVPGPTILTVISYSIARGKSAYLPLIAAVSFGDLTALSISIAGLGVILKTSSWVFTLVKWLGGLYLIALGLQMLFSKKQSVDVKPDSQPTSNTSLFINTWLITALNPKGMIFFLAFFPQFINPNLETTPQLLILSITFIVLAALNTIMYAVFAGHARQLLSSPKNQSRFNLFGGSLLTVAGLWALSAQRE